MHTDILEKKWEQCFLDYFNTSNHCQDDASHDLSHFRRVADMAKQIARYESVAIDYLVILAAAYFHDVVSLPKNHAESKLSSRYAAIKAQEILKELCFPYDKISAVCHAIEAHSFSAQMPPETIEAKIVQDADRMESLGALGIMRTFYVSGRLERPPYDAKDLYAKQRPLDDKVFGFDHFYCKLFKLPNLLQTEGGRQIAKKRADFLHFFTTHLESDVAKEAGGAFMLTWACYHAGRGGHKLFDNQDPLAKNRPLDADLVIDQLIKVRDQYPEFVIPFLAQFDAEIKAS